MRSSIACVRCRRSKVKCVNTGPNTVCRACEASNRECTYPPPVAAGTPRGSAAASGMAIGAGAAPGGAASGSANAGFGPNLESRDAPKKPKPKKPAPSASAAITAASMNTPKAWKECLDSPALTPAVWQQIFDTFQSHNSPTLPFLHPPTFLSRLRSSTTTSNASSTGTSPPAPEKPHSPFLLLGMLTLTARHIQPLLLHHAPAFPTPIAVSEFYAQALKYRLKNDDDESLVTPSLEKIQALLMLTLHEWGQTRRSEAYIWLGIAIRMGAVLGLSWVDVEEGGLVPPASAFYPEAEPAEDPGVKRRKLDNGSASVKSPGKNADFINKEIRRRTFWAMFMLDRALSSGRYSPSGITLAEASRVRLPCEDKGFLFGEDVRTGFLKEGIRNERNGDNAPKRWEIGEEEGLLARVIRVTDIWGQVQEFLACGGTKADVHPPVSPESRYRVLSKEMDDFVETLPHHFQFSAQTFNAHMSSRSASEYAIMHVTLFLSRMILQREFLPLLPLPPPNPKGEEEVLSMAATDRLFSSAKDLIMLLSCLDEWGTTLEAPLIITGVHGAAMSGLYAYTFPWMDSRGFLTGSSLIHDEPPVGTGEEPRKAVDFLVRMKPRWVIAEDDFKHLFGLRAYFTQAKEDYVHRLSSSSPGSQHVRERILMRPENQTEKQRFLSMLSPILPSQPQPPRQQEGRSSGSAPPHAEVDALLLAASGASEGNSAVGGPSGDRWMAVNTVPNVSNAASMTPPMSMPNQQNDPGRLAAVGYLDELAGFAAQQGKMGNGSGILSGGPPMNEPRLAAALKQENIQHHPQQQAPGEVQMGGNSMPQPGPPPGGMDDVQSVDDSRWIDERAGGRGWGGVQVGAME